jgi:predicted phosphodiesterase
MARLAICSDIHSQIDRLQPVLDDIARRGVDEAWCLGDLVGGGPDPTAVIDAVRAWPLVLGGNHDAWLAEGTMWPRERVILDEGRLAWLAELRPEGRRHGIDCWHGSPQRPLDGFLTPPAAALALDQRPPGSWGLVGHTHDPALFLFDGVQARGVVPTPDSPIAVPEAATLIANPGAVVGARTDPATWWLEIDTDARLLTWHRIHTRRQRLHTPTLQLAH